MLFKYGELGLAIIMMVCAIPGIFTGELIQGITSVSEIKMVKKIY